MMLTLVQIVQTLRLEVGGMFNVMYFLSLFFNNLFKSTHLTGESVYSLITRGIDWYTWFEDYE